MVMIQNIFRKVYFIIVIGVNDSWFIVNVIVSVVEDIY